MHGRLVSVRKRSRGGDSGGEDSCSDDSPDCSLDQGPLRDDSPKPWLRSIRAEPPTGLGGREAKWFDNVFRTVLTCRTYGVVTGVSWQIPQGTDVAERLGNRIQVKSIECELVVGGIDTTGFPCEICYLYLVLDTHAQTTFAIGDIVSTTTTDSPLLFRPEQAGRFKVLKVVRQRLAQFFTQGAYFTGNIASVYPVHLYFKFDKILQYTSASLGLPNNYNLLLLCYMYSTDTSANTGSGVVTGTVRTRFVDC